MHRHVLVDAITILAVTALAGCSADPTTPVASRSSTVTYTAPFPIWEREHAYSGTRSVWDPSIMQWANVDHNEVYQLDSAPYFLSSDRREMWTTNFRCTHTDRNQSLGWHRDPQVIQYDWDYVDNRLSWCQRVDWEPWAQSATYLANQRRWWTMATGATWGALETWSNGKPVDFVMVRFTENKTMFGADHVLRRAAPGTGDLDYWGYADIKMDGSPTNPADNPERTRPYDDVGDGYYQGFITLGTIPVNASTNWGANAMAVDHGPIIWPRHGYRQWRNGPTPPGHGANWQQTSRGVRQGHIFQWWGFLYVYYWQEAGIDALGRYDAPECTGIFVARAPIHADGSIGAFACGPRFDASCLPAGYSTATRAAWDASLALPGPDVPPIIGAGSPAASCATSGETVAVPQLPGVVSFAVAALANTSPQHFVGVVERYVAGNPGHGSVQTFTSTDLVHWTFHSTALSWSGDWDDGKTIHYPQPVNATNGDMTSVDAEQFYLVGSSLEGCSGWPCMVKRVRVDNF
jgi:hypothetical protein